MNTTQTIELRCLQNYFHQGYGATKTVGCTLEPFKIPVAGNLPVTGTGEQKRPSVPVWHLKRGLEKFVLGYSVLARDIDMCDSKYDAKCDQKTVPHCDTAEYKLAGGYHG